MKTDWKERQIPKSSGRKIPRGYVGSAWEELFLGNLPP